MNEMDVLKIVVERLNIAGIDYMISGSVALSFYTEPRMTRDIDIVIHLKGENLDKMMEIFGSDFYIDRDMMKEAVSFQSMFNIIHLETLVKIDLIIRKNEEYRLLEFNNRKKRKLNEDDVYVVAIDDLIISKLFWAKDSLSEIQIKDIVNLMKVDFDLEYVKKWCVQLNLEDILRRVLNERHG